MSELGTDGWKLLIIHARDTSPRAMLREVSPRLPPSYLLYCRPAAARRRGSLRRFNYSPGEDDSRWLNSLEQEEEDEMQRRGGNDGRRRSGFSGSGRSLWMRDCRLFRPDMYR